MKIQNNSDIDMTDEEIENKIKKILGARCDLWYTVKILITANGDAVGLINAGVGDVDIYEIGNVRIDDKDAFTLAASVWRSKGCGSKSTIAALRTSFIDEIESDK